MRAAVDTQRHLVLVREADPAKGGLPKDQAIAACPDELRPLVFTEDGQIIRWQVCTWTSQMRATAVCVVCLQCAGPTLCERKISNVLHPPSGGTNQLLRLSMLAQCCINHTLQLLSPVHPHSCFNSISRSIPEGRRLPACLAQVDRGEHVPFRVVGIALYTCTGLCLNHVDHVEPVS